MAKPPQIPLMESVKILQDNYGLDLHSAMHEVDDTLQDFKRRNQKLIERQNDASNNAQIQLISHFALLATLTLTVVGFLITQTEHLLTSNQQRLILFILLVEILSLLFGAIDYLQTINFHKKWAKMYYDVDNEISEKFNDRSLQRTSELGIIEKKHIDRMKTSTKTWVTYVMVIFCILGLFSLLLLFYAYFFDVPFIK